MKKKWRWTLMGSAIGAAIALFHIIHDGNPWSGEWIIANLSQMIGGAIGGTICGFLASFLSKKRNSN